MRNMDNNLIKLSQGQVPTQEQRSAIAGYILDRFANGDEIMAILNSQEYIRPVTFYHWIATYEDINKQYMAARMIKAHQLFDDLLNTARGNHDGKDTLTAVARDRLVTDKMTFYLAKAVPKMYGDKLDVTTNGESINIISLGGGVKPPENTTIDISHNPGD